jgi:glycosyltransferase involved in cell wall biosynthesis
VLSRKPSALNYISSIRAFGTSSSQVAKYNSALQQFVLRAIFDECTVRANDSAFTRISIVMPSYNQVRFIERSILSVLNQNYPNLQFIIMDGGSTDGTLDVIRKYGEYLLWTSERDLGQSDAINKALLLADGELIGWQNSDDVYFPGALHRVHEVAQRMPQAVLYSGTVACIDVNDRLTRVSKFTRPSARRLLYEGFVMSSQGVFWRRDVQSRIGLYDIDLHIAMDVDFWLRMLAQGSAEFLPEIIGGFRQHEGTKTSQAEGRGNKELSEIRKKFGVNDQTLGWRFIRAALRISRLLKWTLVTRPRCKPIRELHNSVQRLTVL